MANTHIDHFDELIYSVEGCSLAQTALDPEIGFTASEKFDGAPAIVYGLTINGTFFMGTKSIFNKTPIVFYNNNDIILNYPEPEKKELRDKLLAAFSALCIDTSYYMPGIAYQADLMFLRFKNAWFNFDDVEVKYNLSPSEGSNPVQVESVSFQPNVSRYVITNPYAIRSVLRATIGLAIHTQYKMGQALAGQTNSVVPPPSQWVKTAIVGKHTPPHHFNMSQKMVQMNTTPDNFEFFTKCVDQLRVLKNFYQGYSEADITETQTLMKRYDNYCVRNPSFEEFGDYRDVSRFVMLNLYERIQSLSSKAPSLDPEKAKANVKGLLTNIRKHEKEADGFMTIVNSDSLRELINLQMKVRKVVLAAKTLLLDEAAKNSPSQGDNLEGFVGIVDDFEGTASEQMFKLVDRTKFSAANFEKNGQTFANSNKGIL